MKQSISEIKVGLNFGTEVLPVGRLAAHEGVIYFEYHTSFIQKGLEISPVRLPCVFRSKGATNPGAKGAS